MHNLEKKTKTFKEFYFIIKWYCKLDYKINGKDSFRSTIYIIIKIWSVISTWMWINKFAFWLKVIEHSVQG